MPDFTNSDRLYSRWKAYPPSTPVFFTPANGNRRYGAEGKQKMSWTDERVDLLRKLWTEGLSASQIAAELGGVTRNAVIGKVHRLGLSGRAKPAQSAASRQKRAPRANAYAKRTTGTKALAPAAKPAGEAASSRSAVVVDVPEPKLLNLNLLQLTESTCKWPIGDPQHDDFAFCGNTARDGDPYCEYHCRLAYQPAADRRNREKRAADANAASQRV